MSLRGSSASRDHARPSSETNIAERWQRKLAREAERQREATRAAAEQRVLDARVAVDRNPFPDIESELEFDNESMRPAVPRRSWTATNDQRERMNSSSENVDSTDRLVAPSEAALPRTPSEAVFSDHHTERTETPLSFYTAGNATPKDNTRDMSDYVWKDGAEWSEPPSLEIKQLMQELQTVKERHSILEKEMEHQYEEIKDLRRQLKEAEKSRIEAPCDPIANENCNKLKTLLNESQAERDDLQERLDAAEKRERELKRQLNAATLQLDNMTDKNTHLENRSTQLHHQLSDARLDQDQQSKTIDALEHQLKRRSALQNTQAYELDELRNELARARRDRVYFEGVAQDSQRQLDDLREEGRYTSSRRSRRDSGTELYEQVEQAMVSRRRSHVVRNSSIPSGTSVGRLRGELVLARPARRLERAMLG